MAKTTTEFYSILDRGTNSFFGGYDLEGARREALRLSSHPDLRGRLHVLVRDSIDEVDGTLLRRSEVVETYLGGRLVGEARRAPSASLPYPARGLSAEKVLLRLRTFALEARMERTVAPRSGARSRTIPKGWTFASKRAARAQAVRS